MFLLDAHVVVMRLRRCLMRCTEWVGILFSGHSVTVLLLLIFSSWGE
jgi:hypothetical protein